MSAGFKFQLNHRKLRSHIYDTAAKIPVPGTGAILPGM